MIMRMLLYISGGDSTRHNVMMNETGKREKLRLCTNDTSAVRSETPAWLLRDNTAVGRLTQ